MKATNHLLRSKIPTPRCVGLVCYLRCLPLLAIMSLLLVGCGTTGKYVRAYQGTPANTNEVALLKVQKGFSFTAIVEDVDGTPLNQGKWYVSNNTQELELLPGKHDLEVAYSDSNMGRSISNAPISFDAEAGKTYELHVAPLERSFGQGLRDQFTSAQFLWTLWILDTETKKVVAGQPRETPIHWYER
jgi:hypothetical protein